MEKKPWQEKLINMGIHQFEMQWIKALQLSLRGPFTDQFFIYCNYLDTFWFVLAFVIAVMTLYRRKEGLALFFIFAISGIVNMYLKKFFDLPRPCQVDPSTCLLPFKTPGFPSGAAQTATIIAGFAIARGSKRFYKILGVLFSLLMCFSRIYLGAHFFTDIFGGIAVGVILVFIYLKLFPYLQNHWNVVAFGFSLILLLFGEKMLPHSAMMIGTGLGLSLSQTKTVSSSLRFRIIDFFFVLSGTILLFYFGKTHPSYELLLTLIAGFWFSYLGHLFHPKN